MPGLKKKKTRWQMFYRMLIMALMLPVMGAMAIPDDDGAGGGGGGDDGKDKDAGAGGGGDDGKDKDGKDKGGAGDDGGDKTHVPKEEFLKVVAERDKNKKERRTLQEKVNSLEGDSKKLKEMETKLAALEERDKKLAEMEAAEEARIQKDLPEIDRLKRENDKLTGKLGEVEERAKSTVDQVRTELTAQVDALTKQNKQLMQHKLSSEIVGAAALAGAHDPNAAVKMLSDRFKLNDDGEYISDAPGLKGGITEKSVAETVKEFFADPSNAWMLKAGGGGPRKAPDPGDGKGGGGKDKSGKSDKLTAGEKREAELRGMTEQDYYDIVILPREKGLEKARAAKVASGNGLLPGQIKMSDR